MLYLKFIMTEPSVTLHYYHRLKSKLLSLARRFLFIPHIVAQNISFLEIPSWPP